MNAKIFIPALIILCTQSIFGQIGIGTPSPVRNLEITSSSSSYIRVHSNSNILGVAGLEFVRGDLFDSPIDWNVVNDGGILTFSSGNYNLYTSSTEHMRITEDHDLGIGTTSVSSRLHITGGDEASLLGNGHVMLGVNSGTNLIMDRNEIQARHNNSGTALFVQSSGGDTYFNSNGGNVRVTSGTGRFGIGTLVPSRKMHINGNSWQLYLNNDGGAGGDNDWHVGASSNTWAVGNHQLVFSPTSSSLDSKFRLRDVTENNGSTAPVSILSNGGQEMLIDGNEIDSRNGPLYLNNNSGHDTYINGTGGQVGVGTTSLNAALTVATPNGTRPLSIQKLGSRWDLTPHVPDGANPWGSLGWYHNNTFFASISGNSGAWFSISDARKKDNVNPLPEVLDRVADIGVYRYAFKTDQHDREYLGVMAQEIETIFPEVVKEADTHKGVAYGQLAVIALKAIQEQQQVINALTNEIERIEAQKK